MDNWGECYLSHYERFLTPPISHQVFRGSPDKPAVIQILSHERVFDQCTVFSTMGVSRYHIELGKRSELVFPVDDGKLETPQILANVAFELVRGKVRIGRGIAVDGLGEMNPQFASKFDREAVYITTPGLFPREFNTVKCGDETGYMYLALYIARSEFQYFMDKGADRFEEALMRASVDPFELRRRKVV